MAIFCDDETEAQIVRQALALYAHTEEKKRRRLDLRNRREADTTVREHRAGRMITHNAMRTKVLGLIPDVFTQGE